MILFINIFSIHVYAEEKGTEDIIKVGVYDSEPYYSIDSNGNVSGYYNDFLNLLQEKYNFKYEYVECDFNDGLEKLEDGKIDIMLGVSIKPERIDKLIFNKNFIAREKFELLTNKNIEKNNLEKLDGLKIGLVEGVSSSEMILEFFSAMNINIDSIFRNEWNEIEELLEEGKVDVILLNAFYKKGKYKSLYEFAGDQVYIAANKNRKNILENMDKAIEELSTENKNQIYELYIQYFYKEYTKLLLTKKILFSILITLGLFIIIFLIIPKIKKNKIKSEIRSRMKNDKYLLQYQPIYNPRNNSIVGFEALLRLLDVNTNLIPPYKFIPEIEKNDMLFEISIWILKKVISDYNEIKYYECVKLKDFYISLNLSLNEIGNDDFVKKAIGILSKANLGANKICLEIIERVRMNDLDAIVENVRALKEAGFKIAIDDFGVEYSNLDILQKLDTDIIKVDKNFVDGINKDIIRNEIVLFVSRLAQTQNKSVVLEGIEDTDQDIKIKKIENDSLYVQGYFYNKPMYKEDIKAL